MALYRVRSTIAHGDVIEESQVKTLREAIPYFETDVRDLVKAALQCCPVDEISRRSWLKSLYDVSDQDRVDKLREDFKSIKTDSLKHELLRDIGSGHLPP
jgi:bisphosphoglycerate-dependent phosphoglycerate mutase